jgi:3-oxoacyl-[acyl-carrier protein] reductase
MDLRLSNKVALITGGSRGIGRSIALRLAEEGCRVAICGRSQTHLERTLSDLQALGVPTSTTSADVTQPGEVERFVEESAANLGGVDLLVANVGGSVGGGLLSATAEDWQKTFDLNLFNAVRAIRSAVPHMQRQGGGSVLVISSISGWKPTRRKAQYATAKAAEIHLAPVLAQELADYRIRVNTLSPGSVIFPDGGWDQFRTDHPETFAQFEQTEFPWGRLGNPEEIADVAVFLLSERSRWINGANIPVDGAQGRPSVS